MGAAVCLVLVLGKGGELTKHDYIPTDWSCEVGGGILFITTGGLIGGLTGLVVDLGEYI